MKHLRNLIGACLGATLLAACGGGITPNAAPAVHQLASVASSKPDKPDGCAANPCIYNSGSNSVFQFPENASGNVAPKHTLTGAATGLVGNYGVALDSGRNIYVVNRSTGGGQGPYVTVYASDGV
jgi:hypothetical protein